MSATPTPPKTQDFRARLEVISRQTGFDLVQIAVKLALHKDPHIRLSALKLLADYSYPRLKSIEHVGDISAQSGFTLRIVRGDALPAPPANSTQFTAAESKLLE